MPALLAAIEVAPLLVFAYGNPSRGDDALAPLLIERLDAGLAADGRRIELLTDFQPQPEHALDLRGRERVLFVDASTECAEPFAAAALAPAPISGGAAFTHATAPGALLSVYRQVEGAKPPPAWLLAIRGYSFALGAPLTPKAEANLAAALGWAQRWLEK